MARFESLVAQARERDDPGERSACLREALALWRGEPLAELHYEAFAEREIARLEELRLAAVEDRVDADLALGRHHELVPELEPLVAEHPFRERLRGQLMLALYRCGRQADALHVFQSGRRALVEELGIDPGPALQQLELRILRQDAGLDLPAGTAAQPRRRFGCRYGAPPVRYARSGDLSIAYQVTGDGPIDLVLISGFVSHLEKDWEEPRHARFLERLGSIARLIRFDKRGTGLSDRPPGVPDLESADGRRARRHGRGRQRARRAVRLLGGRADGDPVRRHLPRARRARSSSTAPTRNGSTPTTTIRGRRRGRRAPPTSTQLERDWGFESDMKIMCPSADEAMARWWGERCRAAASPGAIKALNEMNSLIDVRALLPTIRVPTLVVHRGTDFDVKRRGGPLHRRAHPRRALRRAARSRSLRRHRPGSDPRRRRAVPRRMRRVAPSPPRRRSRCWSRSSSTDDRRLDACRHLVERPESSAAELAGSAVVRSTRQATGCSPPSTARRVRSAARPRSCARSGRSVSASAPACTPERSKWTADRVRGVAVDVAACVAAEAAPGEVLVSQTVNDIVAGSGLEFADRGSRALAGVPGEWRLLRRRRRPDRELASERGR